MTDMSTFSDAEVMLLRARVLPDGIKPVEGEAPPAPPSFEEDYILPEHYDKPLIKLNPVPQNDGLHFHAEGHIYTWKGVPLSASVTSFAHMYETPFDKDGQIKSMQSGRTQSWPRKEYVKGLAGIEEWTPERGALMVYGGKTVSVVQPYSLDASSSNRPDGPRLQNLLHMGLRKECPARCGEEGVELFSFERALTPAEIKAAWEKNGMVASHSGTEAHFQAELLFNGLPFRWWEGEGRVLLTFLRDYVLPNGLVSYATEMEIVSEEGDFGGSVDLILYDRGNDLYHLVDHKRSDKLKREMRGFKKMKKPFSHLDDCKGCSYGLQLSIYQNVLEKRYGMKFGDRVLLSIHPDRPFCTSVPYMKAEVEFLMEDRIALIQARRSVCEERKEFICSLSGVPAWDAVALLHEDEEKGIASEKAAILLGKEYRVDEAKREEFHFLVQEKKEKVNFNASARTMWKDIVPEEGIPPFQISSSNASLS